MNKDEILERYSFTLPPILINKIDKIREQLKINRSMVVREALNHWLEHRNKEIQLNGKGIAIISYTYDHHELRLVEELLSKQHDFYEFIQNTTHIHLSHNNCFEIIVCKGELNQIIKLANSLRQIKGINDIRDNYITE